MQWTKMVTFNLYTYAKIFCNPATVTINH